jgi:CDGSH-type Zn-finger protein
MANIKIMDNGPLFVSGNVELLDGDGNKMETKEQYALCRCGLSTNMPFCTGAHSGKFESKVRA